MKKFNQREWNFKLIQKNWEEMGTTDDPHQMEEFLSKTCNSPVQHVINYNKKISPEKRMAVMGFNFRPPSPALG